VKAWFSVPTLRTQINNIEHIKLSVHMFRFELYSPWILDA
jgi:hypothetical protein